MADDLKALFRKAAMASRKAAFAAGQGQAAEILADFLAEQSGRPLAGYMPMRTEIDPLPAMAVHQGAVGVPVIMAPATPLKFREFSWASRFNVPIVTITPPINGNASSFTNSPRSCRG